MKTIIKTGQRNRTNRPGSSRLLPLLGLLLLGGTLNLWATAASDTWTGGDSPNFNWNVTANWTGGNNPPQAHDTLLFAGTTGLNATNNYTAGTQFNGIFFNAGAGAFNLYGNLLTLGGGITNNASNTETINAALALAATARSAAAPVCQFPVSSAAVLASPTPAAR